MRPQAARLAVEVTYAVRRPWTPRAALFKRWAAAALKVTRPSELSVRVVGTARSRALNAHYRRKDRATNVLSFAGAGLCPDGVTYLGELVICAPLVARESAAQGKAAEAHWAHLTVHGILHLLGFDHEATAEARKMLVREVEVLERLGFSNPYV